MERLDKFLSAGGAGTRSQVKELLKAGRVSVDGLPERDPGRKIDPQKNTVCLDGEILGGRRRVVLMLHKPAGYVTATEDARERTVMELLPPEYRHLDVKPVGRLDKETEGLLLFTNDGQLLHRLISPRSTMPATRAGHPGRMWRPSPRAYSCGTGQGAFPPCWSLWAPGRAGSRCGKENITRCGG